MDRSQRFGAAGVVIAASAAAVAVLSIAAGAFFFRQSAGSDEAAQNDIGPALDKPEDAPAGDIFVRLVPGTGRGPNAEQILPLDTRNDSIPGTVVHLATAISAFGQTELLEWRSFDGAQNQQEPMLCTGAFGQTGGSSGCGPIGEMLADDVPNVGWGSSGGGQGPLMQSVSVDGAPEEAAWMIVKTSDGTRIVANTIAGVGFMEWDGKAGEPSRVALLDVTHSEIWSDTLRGP